MLITHPKGVFLCGGGSSVSSTSAPSAGERSESGLQANAVNRMSCRLAGESSESGAEWPAGKCCYRGN